MPNVYQRITMFFLPTFIWISMWTLWRWFLLFSKKTKTRKNIFQGQRKKLILGACLFFVSLFVCLIRVVVSFSWFYTAVSVWENDCSGIVIRVLEVQWDPCPTGGTPGVGDTPAMTVEATPRLGLAIVSGAKEADPQGGGCTASIVCPAATENLFPLREACFCKTLWMLGLLVACCSCWLSIPCRKAFTTRIWNKQTNTQDSMTRVSKPQCCWAIPWREKNWRLYKYKPFF